MGIPKFLNFNLMLFSVGLTIVGCAAATYEDKILHAGAIKLLAPEMRARYVGNTLSGTTPDGVAFDVYIASKRNFSMLYKNEKSTGTWRIDENGMFCGKLGGGDELCSREYFSRNTITSINVDGSLAGTARIIAGNPKGL